MEVLKQSFIRLRIVCPLCVLLLVTPIDSETLWTEDLLSNTKVLILQDIFVVISFTFVH